ncbi:Cof-type HAD-IIB family hydrolase [Lacrimispora sp.]|uniref:Cof-type HAD-IIB family hydrolase n=1 Tax=Lacrimispora sp. TaxID=2719234 RepID=UPI003992925D
MIKLIVSDIDGTLVPTGSSKMDPEFIEVLKKVLNKNIMFCACSGREYKAMQIMFPEVESKIYLSCQNGNVIFQDGNIIYHKPLDRMVAAEILSDVISQDGCMCLISNNSGYYMIDRPGLAGELKEINFQFEVSLVQTLEQVPGDINQLTLLKMGKAGEYISYFTRRWSDKLHVMLSSVNCIDFCNMTKADSIQYLCELLNIMPEEVMAFGDNYNDITMLEMVGSAYIMENAPRELLSKIPNQCSSVKKVIQSVILGDETV